MDDHGPSPWSSLKPIGPSPIPKEAGPLSPICLAEKSLQIYLEFSLVNQYIATFFLVYDNLGSFLQFYYIKSYHGKSKEI